MRNIKLRTRIASRPPKIAVRIAPMPITMASKNTTMDALPDRLTTRATSNTPSSEAPKQPSPNICGCESRL